MKSGRGKEVILSHIRKIGGGGKSYVYQLGNKFVDTAIRDSAVIGVTVTSSSIPLIPLDDGKK